ncbi:phage minor capsid protein [Subtercola endophyticus]|uniref:phage minor capsid protein n=1 Tax=Subtercola endophyticus TaxID=2895559 RepID=UPI001E3D08F3|nr:phage minor capsid protein [Subtercola endophyticus]UFS59483.1 phage minor capsid protein [Subtercola endophyticus]
MSDTQPSQEHPSSDSLAAQLAALYVLAEQQLLSGASSILRRTQATLDGQQAMVPKLRRLARQVAARLAYQSNPLADRMITAAVTEGANDAEKSVERALGGRGGDRMPPGTGLALPDEPFDLSMPHGERAAQAIRDDITSELEDVRFRITRLPDDIYKWIAPHGAIRQVLANDVTPAQAQAMAWRVFTSQGITGFTDRSGRDWALSSYVEMAVRTASTRAYNDSHLQRMHALNVDYFSVPDDGHPCPLCFPWQGKVLTDGVVADPEMPVDGTIAEATAAGLFHPQCRHVLIPVFPGVTVLPEPREWTPELQAGYALTQRQRHLELQVRKAKRALEYAIDPDSQRKAQADVRLAQAKVREFVAANGLLRQSRREQLNMTDHSIKLPTPIR